VNKHGLEADSAIFGMIKTQKRKGGGVITFYNFGYQLENRCLKLVFFFFLKKKKKKKKPKNQLKIPKII
jgi:hypothetical protein